MAGAARYIVRHIARSRAKTILTAMLAVFFVIALGFLQELISRTEAEIDRLYDTVPVKADVRKANPDDTASALRDLIGDVIGPDAVSGVLDSGLARKEYLEAGHPWAVIIGPDEAGAFPENWEELIGYNTWANIWDWANYTKLNPLLASSDMARFTAEHSRSLIDGITARFFADDGSPVEELYIEYARGYDESSFVFSEGASIPVIVSEKTMTERGLAPGDDIYISCRPLSKTDWTQTPAVIIGVHNRNIIGSAQLRNSAIIPHDAMKYLLGKEIGYIKFSFRIAPEHTRKLSGVQEVLQEIIKPSGWVRLSLHVNDEELRTVVGSLEQNLSLMRLLYPAAITLSILIGLGVSLLLMLQNAKNAAILRVLGSAKNRSRFVLCAEQLLVSLSGLIIGLCALLIAGWSAPIIPAGLFLVGVFAGSAAGSVLVTNRPPLELLQVRE